MGGNNYPVTAIEDVMRIVAVLIFVIVGILGFPEMGMSSSDLISSSENDTSAEETMIGYLKPVLKAGTKVARVYYAGTCMSDGVDYTVSFPSIHTMAPRRVDGGLASIRDIFRNEGGTRIEEDQDGVVRIFIGKVPVSILDTTIPVLNFTSSEQYTPKLALWRITRSEEVKAVERKIGLKLEQPVLRISPAQEPARGLPHIPASMISVTLEKTLDVVAKTFKGIVFYGICSDPGRYVVYFTALAPPPGFPGTTSKP